MPQLARRVTVFVLSLGVLWAAGLSLPAPSSASVCSSNGGYCIPSGEACDSGGCQQSWSCGTSLKKCCYNPGACTPPACPTYCGYGGGTVYGTNSCGGTAPSKYCSPTAACCDANAWGSCSATRCGTTGTQTNACGGTRSCSAPACPTPTPTPTPTPLPTCTLQLGSCVDFCGQCDINNPNKNDNVTCTYYNPVTGVVWTQINNVCTLPGGATSNANCVYNVSCTQGLCHPKYG